MPVIPLTTKASKVAGKGPQGDPVITGPAKGPAEVMEVEIKPTLGELPVFARGGSMIPLQPLVQSTGEKPRGPLELRVYPGANCGGSIYQDDGISFAYRKGEFLRQTFRCEAQPLDVRLLLGAREGSWAPWWKEIEVVLYGWQHANTSVTLNGRPVSGSRYDSAGGVLRIRIPEQANGSELRVNAK
jgi:alpha-glucosidase